MPRKSTATRRSTALRPKAAFQKPRAASFSTDDVYNLLSAVNAVTLKRMEDKNDAYYKNDIDVLNYLKRSLDGNSNYIYDTFQRVFNIQNTVLPRMEQEILAIKTKVGALTRGSTKAWRAKGHTRRR